MSDRPSLAATERAADRFRDELLATLQELERRRERAFNPRLQLAQHGMALGAMGAAVLLLWGAWMGTRRVRLRGRKVRMQRAKVRGLIRAWQHPERLATRRASKPKGGTLFSLATSLLGRVLFKAA